MVEEELDEKSSWVYFGDNWEWAGLRQSLYKCNGKQVAFLANSWFYFNWDLGQGAVSLS